MESAKPAAPAASAADNKFPPQIKYIVGNEACERFGFYGMKGILQGYIAGGVSKGALGMTTDDATAIISMFVAANYFMPLFGAWLSDRIWGRYKTILWISLIYCVGHGVLALSDLFATVEGKAWCLYAGLGLVAVGAGGIKPCVSAFMGDQFNERQGHLLQKAYGAFYWSINFGSFFSFLVIPWFAKNHGYSWAFGIPGILMGVATFIFWRGTRHYVKRPPASETRTAGFTKVLLAARANAAPEQRLAWNVAVLTSLVLPAVAMLGMFTVGFLGADSPITRPLGWFCLVAVALWTLLVVLSAALRWNELSDAYWTGARSRFSDTEISAARSVTPILSVFALIPIFWALFDQSHSTWVALGRRMEPVSVTATFKIGAEEMQSANALFVMILVPLFTLWMYPWLGKMVTPLRRIGCGLFMTSLSFVAVAWLQQRTDAGETLTVMWQTLPYILLTAGEVLVSTTGLEFAFTQASRSMKSTIMSFWLLTVTFGNLFVALITRLFTGGGHESSVTPARFLLYAGLTAAVGVVFVFVATRYRYRDTEVAAQ